MDTIHLVKVRYRVSEYMGHARHEENMHLVFAPRDEVHEKVTAFYEAKTSEYSTYYSVDSIEIMTNIGSPVVG